MRQDEEKLIEPKEDIDEKSLYSNNEKKLGLTKYRFVIVIVYFMLNFSCGTHWVTFASCSTTVTKLYDLQPMYVDLLSIIFMILYPISTVPESYILDNVSTRIGLCLAAIFTIGGAGVKCFIDNGIYFAYLGQGLVALFQPAILNSPAKIAAAWFDDKSRVLVTSICCGANTIGVLVGYLIHGFVFDDDKVTRNDFQWYLMIEFFITVILCLPTLIFMRTKPKIPPSNSQNNYESPPLKKSLSMLFHNSEFVKLLIVGTFIVGFINIFGTIITEYLSRYDITNDQTTYIAATANLCAIIASLIVSIIVDKTKKYKATLMFLNVAGIIFMTTAGLSLEMLSSKYRYYFAFSLYTLIISSIVPIYTTAMDYVCEITYPVGECISGGLIMCFNQIIGALGIVVSGLFEKYFPNLRFLSNSLGLLFFIISLIAIATLEGKLIRNKQDQLIEEEEDSEPRANSKSNSDEKNILH